VKRIIAAVSFALIASPALAQSFDRSPTDPIMPSYSYDPTVRSDALGEERRQVAAAGTTRSDAEISTEAPVNAAADVDERHVERQEGYFDPSN
jgi:hypothetical protein